MSYAIIYFLDEGVDNFLLESHLHITIGSVYYWNKYQFKDRTTKNKYFITFPKH